MRIVKGATLTGTWDWVYPLDDALDREGWRAEEFDDEETRQVAFNEELNAALESNDPPRLKALCVPGQSPTLFKLRHMSGEGKRHLLDHLRVHIITQKDTSLIAGTTLRLAAALALAGVENLTGPNGLAFEVKHVGHAETNGLQVLPRVLDDLETVDGGALVTSMGSAVLGRLTASGN